jgi:hypothetical protein
VWKTFNFPVLPPRNLGLARKTFVAVVMAISYQPSDPLFHPLAWACTISAPTINFLLLPSSQ